MPLRNCPNSALSISPSLFASNLLNSLLIWICRLDLLEKLSHKPVGGDVKHGVIFQIWSQTRDRESRWTPSAILPHQVGRILDSSSLQQALLEEHLKGRTGAASTFHGGSEPSSLSLGGALGSQRASFHLASLFEKNRGLGFFKNSLSKNFYKKRPKAGPVLAIEIDRDLASSLLSLLVVTGLWGQQTVANIAWDGFIAPLPQRSRLTIKISISMFVTLILKDSNLDSRQLILRLILT